MNEGQSFAILNRKADDTNTKNRKQYDLKANLLQ